MSNGLKKLESTPFAGLFGLVMVWCSLALGHSFIVIQHGVSAMGVQDALFSGLFGFAGCICAFN